MRRNPAVVDEVHRLWRRHRHADFPERLRAEEVAGVDLAAVTAEVAGCVEAWRGGSGRLDDEHRSVLSQAINGLEKALPHLPSRTEAMYFDRLRRVVLVILGG